MATKISMGYWVWESMGYGHKIPANQFGKLKILWIIKEYGLYGVWVISESTVVILSFFFCKLQVGSRHGCRSLSTMSSQAGSLSHLHTGGNKGTLDQ